MTQTMWEEEMQGGQTVGEVVNFWGGTLADVKEVRTLLPTASGVKMQITDVTINDANKEGVLRNWRTIRLKLRIMDGIEVAGETKFKGTFVSSDSLCYYANLDNYDLNKPFFSKGQYLIELKKLCMATGLTPSLIKGGLSEETIKEVASELKNKIVLGNIMQKKVQALSAATGKYEDTEDLENIVKGFRQVPDTMML